MLDVKVTKETKDLLVCFYFTDFIKLDNISHRSTIFI